MKLLKTIMCIILFSLSFQSFEALANEPVQTNNESTGAFIDGSVITAKVKAKIIANKHLKSSDISVTTQNDTVILSGTVHSEHQKNEAGKLAKLVDGVKTVDNQLVITK